MSDCIDLFRDMKDMKRLIRDYYGVPCPRCRQEQPKRQATIMLPGRVCKVHRPAYRDPRPELTQEQINVALEATLHQHGAGNGEKHGG